MAVCVWKQMWKLHFALNIVLLISCKHPCTCEIIKYEGHKKKIKWEQIVEIKQRLRLTINKRIKRINELTGTWC